MANEVVVIHLADIPAGGLAMLSNASSGCGSRARLSAPTMPSGPTAELPVELPAELVASMRMSLARKAGVTRYIKKEVPTVGPCGVKQWNCVANQGQRLPRAGATHRLGEHAREVASSGNSIH